MQKDAVAEMQQQEPQYRRPMLFLVQHYPVYTLGAASSKDNLLFDAASSPIPLYITERGGEVTYHGPGQLVLYPILDLRNHRQDLHWYMRALEQVAIDALGAVSGLQGEREAGLTGMWCQGAKLAAIGVRASRWITYHGMALNVTVDLSPFRLIVPCGIAGRPVASVKSLLAGGGGGSGDGTPAAPGWQVDDASLLRECRAALLEAFADVFSLSLEAQEPAAAQEDSLASG